MSSADLIYQGLELALIGMGTVFTFLTVLVCSTALMSWLVRKLTPADGTPAAAPSESVSDDDGEVIAAIAAALRMHRAGRIGGQRPRH